MDENIVIKAMDSRFDGVDKFDVVDELLDLEAKNKRLEEIGEKYAKATEYYDEFKEGEFVLMPFLLKKITNQIGKEILQILQEKPK